MPFYKVHFLDENGKKIRRELFASNRQELLKNLSLSEQLVLKVRKKIDFRNLAPHRRKISPQNFLIFNRELISLLKAGTPLKRALEVIMENCTDSLLKQILIKALNDIKNGVSLSRALSSDHFPLNTIYSATLLAGERSGQLEAGLEKFCAYIGRVAQLKRKTISSLTYPMLVISFMLVIVTIIISFVIPKFAGFYADFDAELPFFTTLFLELSVFLKNHILFFLGGLVLLFFSLRAMERRIAGFSLLAQLRLKIPFIGPSLVYNHLAIFCRTLATLLTGGLTIPEAASLAVKTISNKYLYLQIRDLSGSIEQGRSLFQAMQEVRFVPKLMLEMVQVGENSGNLVRTLEEASDHYESFFENRIGTLISLIEPIIIILLGVVVSFMIISIYLPIFSTIRVVE
jgi:type IV pilus assembly protein PilC